MQREQIVGISDPDKLCAHAVVLGPSMYTFDTAVSYTSSKPSPVLCRLQGGVIAASQATAAVTGSPASHVCMQAEWHHSGTCSHECQCSTASDIRCSRAGMAESTRHMHNQILTSGMCAGVLSTYSIDRV